VAGEAKRVTAPSKSALISCRNLTKIYKMGQSEVRALDGVDLDIMEGEFVAIIGSSGSGKSTLMNMLGALDQPTTGQVMINGENVGTMKSKSLAEFRNATIGFVFQQFQLLPKKSALKNVALPLQYRKPRVKDAAQQAAHALSLVGLAERSGHRPTELSGGQQQRVAIARALAGNPKVLLADEPTGALDSKTSTDIMALMQDLNAEGITIIVITHEHEVAAYAQRVIEFKDGRIISDKRNEEAAA
jgi:putative ABC transport system ATP-binding protein